MNRGTDNLPYSYLYIDGTSEKNKARVGYFTFSYEVPNIPLWSLSIRGFR
jgi:hypothetical protein